MPIPQPSPGPTGVRQADGLGLCHGLPSEAAGLARPEDRAGVLIQRKGQETLSRLFPWPRASPLRPLGPWEKSNPFPL